ncbi:MAG: hypothetical protein WC807_19820 [Hyphomicrobium sp.]
MSVFPKIIGLGQEFTADGVPGRRVVEAPEARLASKGVVRALEQVNIEAQRFNKITEDDVSDLDEEVMDFRGRAVGPIDLLRVTAKKKVMYHTEYLQRG